MGDDRQQVARKQAELLAALRGNASTPPNFNVSNVTTAREALLRKRARGIEKSWPGLATALGPDILSTVDSHTRATENIQFGGPFAEGFALANWLYDNGKLPTPLVPEFLRVSLNFALAPQGLKRRKGLRMKVVKTTAPLRYIIGVAAGNIVRVFSADLPDSRPGAGAPGRYVE